MAAASYPHQYHDHHCPLTVLNRDDDCFMRAKSQTVAKRKSAVELLQETKPLYVKSEIVLDMKHELRRSLRVYQHLPNPEGEESLLNGGSGVFNFRLNNSSSPPFNSCLVLCPSFPPPTNGCSVPFPLVKSPRLIPPPPAFRKSTCSLQLQNKLRKLLNADSKENLLEANSSVVADGSIVQKNDERNDGFDSTIFSNKPRTARVAAADSVNDYNCHKSLPDLTNVRDISHESYDRSAERRRCNCTPSSTCSNGFCKNSSAHFAGFNLTPYQNECCSSSADWDEYRNWKCLDNDEPDKMCMRKNSLPTSPVKSCISYVTPPSLYCDTNELLRNRPVSRSKSDVGSRYLSSLQSVDIPPYESVTLNTFFDRLGLQQDEYDSLTAPRSNTSSPVYFSSNTSSFASVGGRGSGNENLPINPTVDSPSIVERNARIIKWLCNCRKALEQVPLVP